MASPVIEDHIIAISKFIGAYKDVVDALNGTLLNYYPIEILLDHEDDPPLPDILGVLSLPEGIAIPISVLNKAFIWAKRVFFDHEDPQQKFEACLVLMLRDADYITAVNYRKGFISRLPKDRKGQLRRRTLLEELMLLKSLLNSAIFRHAKSETLWAHRRWVMRQLGNARQVANPLAVSRELLDFVPNATRRQAPNYYAWHYLRWYLRFRRGALLSLGHRLNRHPLRAAVCIGFFLRSIQVYCHNNPNDISAWTFLLWLVTTPLWNLTPTSSILMRSLLARNVLGEAVRSGWRNEVVWVFLRTMAWLPNTPEDVRYDIFEAAREIFDRPAYPDSDTRAMRDIDGWLESLGPPAVDDVPELIFDFEE